MTDCSMTQIYRPPLLTVGDCVCCIWWYSLRFRGGALFRNVENWKSHNVTVLFLVSSALIFSRMSVWGSTTGDKWESGRERENSKWNEIKLALRAETVEKPLYYNDIEWLEMRARLWERWRPLWVLYWWRYGISNSLPTVICAGSIVIVLGADGEKIRDIKFDMRFRLAFVCFHNM